MRFVIDAQLPRGLSAGLKSRGHDGVYVPDILGGQTPDSEIAAYAIAEARILITKDADFSALAGNSGLIIVWLRVGNVTNQGLIEWLEPRWNDVEAALIAGDNLVEVI